MEHDCRTCTRSELAKREWGCLERTERPQLWIPCVVCGQEEERCKECGGSGWEAIHRCPYALVDAATWELVYLHAHWPAVLPYAGGLYEQPAAYVQAMRLLDAAVGRMREVMREEQERQQRIARPTRTA